MLAAARRFTVLALVTSFAMTGVPSGAAAPGGPSLFIQDNIAEIALAQANGERTISMLFAAKTGQTPELAANVKKLGGVIRYENDAVDYLRARVPMSVATMLATGADIDVAEVDRNAYTSEFPYNSEPDYYTKPPSKSKPFGDAPLHHPYWPGKAVGADRLLAAHPTFDGRGATIGYMDGSLPDILLPEYRDATTLDGTPEPKVLDVMRTTDPTEDARDLAWIDMKTVLTSTTTDATYRGKPIVLPHPGSFRIGAFAEPPRPGYNGWEFQQDIERNGRPPGDDGVFPVLWDTASNQVWVDTERNGDFAAHAPMTDFHVHRDIGTFGHDQPGSPIRKTIGFAVQTDLRDEAVCLLLFTGDHATLVTGQSAANGGPLGRYRGIAPGARYVFAAYGSTAHGQMEALIGLAMHPEVDVIVYEINALLSMGFPRSDGHQLGAEIADRIATRLKKSVVVTGGNSGGVSELEPETAGTHVLAISGYQSRENWLRNNSIDVGPADGISPTASSHGPVGDGDFKPDVLSPTENLGSSPGFSYPDESLQHGRYLLPPGYNLGGGTSEATPDAAGALAVLISAAKQAGLPYDAGHISYAVRNGARPIAGYPPNEQGNGVIDLAKAFTILAASARVHIPAIAVQAPVKTVSAGDLRTPYIGRGLYEREGWTAGASASRTVTLTRTSGSAAAATFGVRWLSNDGTFGSAASVRLPLDVPVAFSVRIHAATEGTHSAVMALSQPGIPGDPLRMLATIVAAPTVTPAALVRSLRIPRPGNGGVFFRVAPGTGRLTVSVKTHGVKDTFAYAVVPNLQTSGIQPNRTAGGSTYTFERPMPGVWEFVAENLIDVFGYAKNTPKRMTPTPTDFTMTASTPAPVAMTKLQASTVAAGSFASIGLHVPAHVARMTIELETPHVGNDARLAILQCTRASCQVVNRLAWPGTNVKLATIQKPESGKWVAVVSAFGAPAGTAIPYALRYAFDR